MSLPFSRWTRALSRTLARRSTGKPASRLTATAAKSRFGAPIKAAALAFAMSGIGVSLPTQAAWQLVPDSSGPTATLTAQGSQFVVATHSPVLLALPGANILELTGDGVRRVSYDDAAPVSLTRAFLDDPQAFLRHLG